MWTALVLSDVVFSQVIINFWTCYRQHVHVLSLPKPQGGTCLQLLLPPPPPPPPPTTTTTNTTTTTTTTATATTSTEKD